MIETLFELYDMLTAKEDKLEVVVENLGAKMNDGYLMDELEKLEFAIVQAYGGNEGHFAHINSTDLFYIYRDYRDDNSKIELIEYIQLTIEKNWTDQVKVIFQQG